MVLLEAQVIFQPQLEMMELNFGNQPLAGNHQHPSHSKTVVHGDTHRRIQLTTKIGEKMKQIIVEVHLTVQ